MAYLIDSDVLTDYLQRDADATALVESFVPAGIAMSVITFMETWQGTLRAADPADAQTQHAALLGTMPVLPVSMEIGRRCAELRFHLQEQGRRVRPRALDLLIAATALEYDLTLLTRNRTDYLDVPNLRIG